jgi:hypothetical protein
MPDGDLPYDAKTYEADKDQAYSVLREGVENIYCDGSNHAREWLENLLAWCMLSFFGMFYSFGNVAKEMFPQILNKTKDTTNRARIIAHSRGVFGLGIALKLHDIGWTIEEVILYGVPKPGMWRFARECKKRGINITFIKVDGDWVTNRPFYGKQPKPTKHIKLANEDNLKGIKAIHTSYGMYLEREGM